MSKAPINLALCVSIDKDIQNILGPLLDLTLAKFKGQVKLTFCQYDEQTSADFAVILNPALRPRCPYIAIVDEASYTGELVESSYINDYPVKAFFVKEQLLRDPDEIAGLLSIVKDEIRRIIVSKEGEESGVNIKKINWKAGKNSVNSDSSQFMTVLWDQKMQDFLSELSFHLRRMSFIDKKERISSREITNLFQEICEAMKNKSGKKSVLTQIEDDAVFKALTAETNFKTQHILIEGETGSGKSMLASLIHEMIKKITKDPSIPFQTISAANQSADLIQGELFGALSGAYTDAVSYTGNCALAHGGIVFIDELGCLPPEAQSKLLVFLDKFRFRPMNWPFSKPAVAPALVIAATNANLPKMILEERFRDDLYQRFRIRMRVPALRERMRNFRLLVDVVLSNPIVNPKGSNGKGPITGISVTALKKLEGHPFPGNFRELESVLSRAVLRAQLAGVDAILASHITF